ncbi:methylmalonyl Co-A mutase-associated GTPase MeaB [Hydrogenophilus islandicus]
MTAAGDIAAHHAADASLLLLTDEDRQRYHGVLRGELRALAKTITLIESQRADHRARAERLIQALLPHSGKAVRLGISGVPGVGKSTFIEALGLYLIDKGHRVAVLAVDPSSSLSGGSILGDKTRMERLSQDPRAFIRPSPAGQSLGGVAERTREAIIVVEAAGYDVVIVETVGVGQSETAVASMTDLFALLQLPNAGDELQGIKKGIMELADLIAVNKADSDPKAAARAKRQLEVALHLMRPTYPDWQVPVLLLSAIRGEGVAEFWSAVMALWQRLAADGRLTEKRRRQAQVWLWEAIDAELKRWFRAHPQVRAQLPEVEQAVHSGALAAIWAARQLLAAAGVTDVSDGVNQE